jgi:hypothetical protein
VAEHFTEFIFEHTRKGINEIFCSDESPKSRQLPLSFRLQEWREIFITGQKEKSNAKFYFFNSTFVVQSGLL